MLKFDNSFIRALPGDPETKNFTRQVRGVLWSAVVPTSVSAPKLLIYSCEMAATLGLTDTHVRGMVDCLAGNAILPGSEPYATVYGGHQFGNWAGQLGDGRAINLGEVVTEAGRRWELQLKGAGPTPYSRRADGRAVLRSSIREFLCSETMFHLGIATTRALSLVATGDQVMRDMFYDGHAEDEPGAIVCRVAPSFTRFGHFEILAARGETALLQQFVDFTIKRDYPDLLLPTDPAERVGDWFGEVAARTAVMVAGWMRVGFVHGVMNTDNMSILGLTIDYGPYGWVDNFDPGWTPNTTDAAGKRYCLGRQPEIARWNLERLASALLMLEPEKSARGAQLLAGLNHGLARFDDDYASTTQTNFAGKFGLVEWRESDADLVNDLFRLLRDAEVDMTIFFRQLAKVSKVFNAVKAPGDGSVNRELIAEAFYRDDLREEFAGQFEQWLLRYVARIGEDDLPDIERAKRMNQFNPRYVLRNYLVQQAIDDATAGDTTMLHTLLDVMRNPYGEQAGREAFAAKRPDWARHKAGCSMLSCSS